jgi:hypothetical protein
MDLKQQNPLLIHGDDINLLFLEGISQHDTTDTT